MNVKHLVILATVLALLVVAGSAFAQEAAEVAEAPVQPSGPSLLIFLAGSLLVVGVGSYLAINTVTKKDDSKS